VPTDERAVKGTDKGTDKGSDRCEMHPGVPSVAHCDRCRRALCVDCAVPVRGRILGPECVPPSPGEAPGPDSPPPGRVARRPGLAGVGAAFAICVALTALPWTRFGHASGPFDAWRWPRWSLMAAVAAVVGLAVWAFQWWRPRMTDRTALLVLASLAAVTTLGGLLAGLAPAPLTKSTWVPWVVAATGAVATLAAARSRRTSPRSNV
jgi:hypothetical protein